MAFNRRSGQKKQAAHRGQPWSQSVKESRSTVRPLGIGLFGAYKLHVKRVQPDRRRTSRGLAAPRSQVADGGTGNANRRSDLGIGHAGRLEV